MKKELALESVENLLNNSGICLHKHNAIWVYADLLAAATYMDDVKSLLNAAKLFEEDKNLDDSKFCGKKLQDILQAVKASPNSFYYVGNKYGLQIVDTMHQSLLDTVLYLEKCGNWDVVNNSTNLYYNLPEKTIKKINTLDDLRKTLKGQLSSDFLPFYSATFVEGKSLLEIFDILPQSKTRGYQPEN